MINVVRLEAGALSDESTGTNETEHRIRFFCAILEKLQVLCTVITVSLGSLITDNNQV